MAGARTFQRTPPRVVSYTIIVAGFGVRFEDRPRYNRTVNLDRPDRRLFPALRFAMFRLNHLLCLVSRVSPPPALRQAVYLARSTGATLHVLPFGNATPCAVKATLREQTSVEGSKPVTWCLPPLPKRAENLVEGVRRYVREQNIGLLLTDTPTDRGPIPPLAAPAIRALVTDLDCSTFVVEHRTKPTSIKRFLVPTDFSKRSSTALKHAAALASVYDASIDLLHVIDGIPYVALTPVDRLSMSLTSFPERRARHQLASFLEKPPIPASSIETHFKYGDPANQISKFVHKNEIDLLVLPAKSRDASSHSPLGPVADRVLRRVTCPLFLVRPGTSPLHAGTDAREVSSRE